MFDYTHNAIAIDLTHPCFYVIALQLEMSLITNPLAAYFMQNEIASE